MAEHPDSGARFGHVPVLVDRCVGLLTPALTRRGPDGSGAVVVDATLGAGGHAERLLSRFHGLRVIGIDRDPMALEIAQDRLASFGSRVSFVRARYDTMTAVLAEYGRDGTADGVLFDLGVSSMQLDRVSRGFSYAQDAPLDMRMDPDSGLTAADILNTYDTPALIEVLRRYGEERFSARIAAQIVRRREREPFTSTGQLTALLYQTIPAPVRRAGGHPAKRTFQALRVAVNEELSCLADALPQALRGVDVGGRVVALAYQSLEDRIVKRLFADATTSRTPAGLPVELPGTAPRFSLLTRGAERAPEDEIRRNTRAAAVRLRAVEKTGRSQEEAAGPGERVNRDEG